MQVNLVKHVFSGVQAWTRKFLFQGDGYTDGLLSQMVETYGVVKKASDAPFDALKVVQGGSADTISINAGNAVVQDANGQMQRITYGGEVDKFTIANDSTNYYVVLSYATTTLEEGTVSISADGVITGTSTKFQEILRGTPDFETRVIFPNSAANTGEYIVAAVTDDLNATLNAVAMTAEVGQQYTALEAQVPTENLSQASRAIYQRPSYTIELRTSDTLVANQEIILATAVYSGGASVTITDRRSENLLSHVDTESLTLTTNSEVIAGVEQIQYDLEKADKSMNRAKIGWGIRVEDGNYTPNAASNIIQISDTANSLYGGAWTSGSPFANDDLNGWRCYFDDGTYLTILDSAKNGTYGIDLTFSDYPSSFATSGQLHIVPDADGIEITVEPSDFATTGNPRITNWFAIEDRVGVMRLMAGQTFGLTYRLTKRNVTSAKYTVNTVAGLYQNESSFNADGTLNVSQTSVASAGAITTLLHTDNHHDKKAWINQNNIFTGGVNSETTGTDASFGGNSVTLPADANYYNLPMPSGDIYWMSDIGEEGCKITVTMNPSSGGPTTTTIYNNEGTAPAGYLKFISVPDSSAVSYATYSRSGTFEFTKVNVGGTLYWKVTMAAEETNPSSKIETNLATLNSFSNAWADHTIQAADITVVTGTAAITLNSGTIKYHSIGSTTFASMDLDITVSGAGGVDVFTIDNWPVTGTVNDFVMNGAEAGQRNTTDLIRPYSVVLNGTTATFTSLRSDQFMTAASNWTIKEVFTHENDL